LIYDDRGNGLSPSFSVKQGVRYRYYVSSPIVRGQKMKAGPNSTVSAPAIEAEIARLVRTRFKGTEKEGAKPIREHRWKRLSHLLDPSEITTVTPVSACEAAGSPDAIWERCLEAGE
jgi:hypothetical protein